MLYVQQSKKYNFIRYKKIVYITEDIFTVTPYV